MTTAEKRFETMLTVWGEFVLLCSDGNSKQIVGFDVMPRLQEAIRLSDAWASGIHRVMLDLGVVSESQVNILITESNQRLLSLAVLFLVSGLDSAHFDNLGDFKTADANNVFEDSELLEFATEGAFLYFGGYYALLSKSEMFVSLLKKAGDKALELYGSEEKFKESMQSLFLKSGKSVFELGRLLYLHSEQVQKLRKQ